MTHNPPPPVIEVKNLRVNYGERVVLDNINMSVAPKEIRVILGPSGCGKTTLLKTIVGLLSPSGGSVRLFGRELGDLDSPDALDLLRHTGILFQNGALLGSLTVAENAALPLEMHTSLPASLIREIVMLKLSQVGLLHAADLLPEELSGGMRKRAALARALVLDPPVLFCDEPSAGLDPVTAAGLDDLLLSLRETLAITIVVVTHELASINRIADNIVFLYNSAVFYEGPMAGAAQFTDGPVFDFFMRKDSTPSRAAAAVDSLFCLEHSA
jgi:phospholipid/cholesterol/gamma-HCH transport system ATP-binding protein